MNIIKELVEVPEISHNLPPIPVLPGTEGWKQVLIKECGESLVPIESHPKILVEPVYYLRGIKGAVEKMYTREAVILRLQTVAERLPFGLALLIWDARRPVGCQEGLFESFKTQLEKNHPDWDGERLLGETQRYVSLPSVNPNRPSPHNTGGAVDLTLADGNGQPLPMGTDFDDFSPRAGTLFFEGNAAVLSPEEFLARDNRRRLFWLMKEAGFTNYPEEWWHFDYGNQFWGKQTGEIAIYGPISPR